MTSKTEQSPVINSTEAQLFVADIQASCDFYSGKLGFKVAFVYGDPPFYAQVVRDQAKLNLRVVGEPVFAGDIREREHLLSATLTLAGKDEIEELFQAFDTAGVPFSEQLTHQPWGAIKFTVRDPDGNRILFTAPAI
jgi:catechol 2,3-dioxygenase-like lactoylglutathione lyase family enzyme